MIFRGLLLLVLTALHTTAYAQDIDPSTERRTEPPPIEAYQIGDWGRLFLSPQALYMSPYESLRKALSATANIAQPFVGNGTAFYVGEYRGEFLMATNEHVCSFKKCPDTLFFETLGEVFLVKKVLGAWPTIDFSLFTIEVPAEQKASLRGKELLFDFATPIEKGQLLVIAGYGVAGPSRGRMTYTHDTHCKVFSESGDYRLIQDGDEINPTESLVWSFASGCDISHGDSGSAVLDRSTAKVVGLAWTGALPKPEDGRLRDRTYVNALFEDGGATLWTELTYNVPAVKIHEHLSNWLEQQDSAGANTLLISDFLKQGLSNDN